MKLRMLLICLFSACAAFLAAGARAQDAQAMMKKSDCFTCHSVDKKIVGPAYRDVAKKYAGDKKAVAKLVKKVKAGGSGNWGAVPMAAHPALKDADVKKMVTWILSLK